MPSRFNRTKRYNKYLLFKLKCVTLKYAEFSPHAYLRLLTK